LILLSLEITIHFGKGLNLFDIPLDDKFEDAFFGVGYHGGRGPFAVYDLNICLNTLEAQGVPEDKAAEILSHETLFKWADNNNAPIFIQGLDIGRINDFIEVCENETSFKLSEADEEC